MNGLDSETVYRQTEELAGAHVREGFDKYRDMARDLGIKFKQGTIRLPNDLGATIVYQLSEDKEIQTVEWTVTKVDDRQWPHTLYHVTDLNSLKKILPHGLEPGNGENCILASDESKDKIFLCGVQDVVYWSILLGKDKVVKVQTEGLDKSDFEFFDYGLYGEWITSKPIPSKYIDLSSMYIPRAEVMSELCEHYILSLSYLIVTMTKVGTYPDRYVDCVNNINHDVISLIKVMERRLDFASLNDSYITRRLIEKGDSGEYTMCDNYCVKDRYGDKRLWEQLILYDFNNEILSKMKESYVMVYEFIRHNFQWARELSTGGYTG